MSYSLGLQLTIVIGLLSVLAKYAFALDVPTMVSTADRENYWKRYLPAIYPQLRNYVPPPRDRSSCPRPIPGARKMFYGIDITRFDFFPDDGFMQGFKSPVMKMSCDNGEKYSTHGKGVDMPDQLSQGVTTSTAKSASETVSVFQNKSDVRKEMALNAEVSGSVGLFSFSSSSSYKSMEHTIVNKDRFIQEVSGYEGSFKMINTDPALDEHVQNYVDKYLTGTYESNTAAYEKFIETYGTHYIYTGHFGGLIKVVIETKKDFLSKSKKEDIEVRAKAAYDGAIKSGSISFGMSKGKAYKNEAYNEASTTKIKYYGGSANLLISEGFRKWQPTVDKDPWLVKAKLTPIPTLIKDATKRKNLEEAIKIHLYRAYYKELTRTKFVLSEGGAIIESKDMMKFGLWGKSMLDLQKDIKYHFITPEWFLGKICMRPGTKEYLSKCNVEDTVKKEYTHFRFINEGESKDMAYGLFSKSKLPNWAKSIKLCYRYRGAAGDTICKGKGEQCVAMNSYTSLKYAVSDSYQGGLGDCYVSWKLSIPHNSPVWLQNNKLCLFYGPHGLARGWNTDPQDLSKQCNSADDPRSKLETCASANEWTPYWRDGTTSGSKGKCWMQMSLQNVDGYKITVPYSGP